MGGALRGILVEVYKKGLILYDTGDFIDDYTVGPLRNDQSFLFRVTLSKKGPVLLELVPVLIDNMQVKQAKQKDAIEIIKRMQSLSAAFGTRFKLKPDAKRLLLKLGLS